MCFLSRFCLFFKLLDHLFVLLLLFTLSIDHINVAVEVIFDLLHFPFNHLFDLWIFLFQRVCRSLMDLSDNFVENLCLKLVLVILSDWTQLW